MRRFGVKKLILLAWACSLAFGLTFQSARADALHGPCMSECTHACKNNGGCDGGEPIGPCQCYWMCSDGTDGTSICVE